MVFFLLNAHEGDLSNIILNNINARGNVELVTQKACSLQVELNAKLVWDNC